MCPLKEIQSQSVSITTGQKIQMCSKGMLKFAPVLLEWCTHADILAYTLVHDPCCLWHVCNAPSNLYERAVFRRHWNDAAGMPHNKCCLQRKRQVEMALHLGERAYLHGSMLQSYLLEHCGKQAGLPTTHRPNNHRQSTRFTLQVYILH
jgi:hypothetical protein